jgi:hypothetical protein
MEEVRTHGDTQFQQEIASLATDAAARPPPGAPKALQRSARWRLYWLAGLLSPVVLGAIGVVLLWQWNPAVGVPAAPAAILAVFEGNPCALRMARIMTAISAYQAQRGATPHTLAELVPGFLSEPVVDPGSGQPYGYEHNGDSVVVVCPNADRHVPGEPAPLS